MPLDILDIPQQLKESIWKKAQDLVADETAIVNAPGEDCAWCVKSYSNKRPHYVRKSKCGGFLCDEQCLSFKSNKLCSHTVALATKMECMSTFTKWFRTMKHKPNFTALVETGKPKTAGKKSVRRGASKKNAKEIKEMVANAEDADLRWKTRGAEQCDDDPDDDDSISELAEPCTLSSSLPSSSQLASSMPAEKRPVSSATTLIMSPRDVHSIRIGGVHTTLSGPPPLISAASVVCSPSPRSFQQERPSVETPFWLVFIFGNISRCIMDAKGRYAVM